MKNIAVLGSGSWGMALAAHLGQACHDVRLWGRSPELVADMKARRTNATSGARTVSGWVRSKKPVPAANTQPR